MRVRTERDLRIDFFRGLALLIIFVDHVQRSPSGKADYRWAKTRALQALAETAN